MTANVLPAGACGLTKHQLFLLTVRLAKDKCFLAIAAKYFLSAKQANGLSDDRVRRLTLACC